MLEAWNFWFKMKRNFFNRVAKTKGADQLCSYCTADLRLCFSPLHIVGFLFDGPNAVWKNA